MDLGARQENLHARGEPILLQLCVVPAYSLTVLETALLTVGCVVCLYLFMRFQRKKTLTLQVHKTQALSIKHLVLGCLEGVFALGQVYVLVPKA